MELVIIIWQSGQFKIRAQATYISFFSASILKSGKGNRLAIKNRHFSCFGPGLPIADHESPLIFK
jgi:hypothetical protein